MMIIVEVKVPLMGKKYDFQIDEKVPLCRITEEIAEIICQKEQYIFEGNRGRLLMWDARNKKRLNPENSASENGLKTGSVLILA